MEFSISSQTELDLLGFFLNEKSWRVPEQLEDLVVEGAAIEIQSLDEVQLFRNFHFLRSCSFSLLALETQPSKKLFERSAEVSEFIAQEFQIDSLKPQASKVPRHFVKERGVDGRSVVEITPQFFVPIYDQLGEKVAVLSSKLMKPHKLMLV